MHLRSLANFGWHLLLGAGIWLGVMALASIFLPAAALLAVLVAVLVQEVGDLRRGLGSVRESVSDILTWLAGGVIGWIVWTVLN